MASCFQDFGRTISGNELDANIVIGGHGMALLGAVEVTVGL